jgi:hypothetical protein
VRAAWVVLLIVSVALPANADKERAKEIAARARRAAEDGKTNGDKAQLAASIRLYREAYAADPNPLFHCNMALSYQVQGDLPRAHALFTRCLRRLPAVQPSAVPVFRPALEDVERQLPEHHVAVDVVTTPEGASLSLELLAGDEAPNAPTVVWLPVGAHEITASLAGYLPASTTIVITDDDVAGHPRKSVRLSLEASAPAVVEKIVDRPVAAPRRTAAWVALGTGGALVAAGGVMHAITYRTRSRLSTLTGSEYDDELPTFQTQRGATIALYAAGVVSVIVGAVLYRRADRFSIAPADRGGAMLWIDLSP